MNELASLLNAGNPVYGALQAYKGLLALGDADYRENLKNGLLRAAQGVSRGISADLLGGPVDLTTQVLNVPLGMVGKKIEKPVGGSEWIGSGMESVGLLQPANNSPEEIGGRFLGGLLASPQVVGKVGQSFENVATGMAKNAMVPNRLNPQTGAIVYHGSPHKFDKFDSSKIGTGEGAQAYGHGLYFAESPEVAKNYASALAAKNGLPVDKLSGDLAQLVTQKGGIDEAKKFVQERLIAPYSKYSKEAYPAKKIKEYAEWIDRLDAMKLVGGNTYKVDLPDEAIAKMLDWDKPLSQQSKEVQRAWLATKKSLPPNAADDLGGDFSLLYGKEVMPVDFLNTLASLGGRKDLGEGLLGSQGIPGIRYLDGGSRSVGTGTSNYVVFPGNEGLLKILGRE